MTRGERRIVLGELVVATLNAVKPNVKSATWYDPATEPRRTRDDRVAVMGDPAYYVELLPAKTEPRRPSEGGAVMSWLDTIRITLWLQGFWVVDDAYDDTTMKTFEDLIWADPGGLITVLHETQTYKGTLGTITIRKPSNVVEDLLPLDLQAEEAAHELTLLIEVF